MTEQVEAAQDRDGRADFDFFLGVWDSKQRRLTDWLKGCDTWREFTGVSVARKTLDGLGHMDEVILDTPTGRVVGLTVRVFDPQTRLWSIYWVDSRRGVLQAPMVGGFQNGRGEFYDRETFDGVNIFSRFIWTSSGPNTCHWEQAFSADGGRTWETNWTADFTRREDSSAI
ncbi:MAG TPA: hypothetical protein VFQ25_00115 [Ktedonobacterales bacterium]|nr:hypothetical protein [Ktedonobacterales bacterium]